ncbi:MAG: DUF1365 domain-containing protein, partial [Gammaproteobacteria bacterium]
MNSQWLTGTIRHRRTAPVSHEFCYRTGLLALDLDEWTCLPKVSPWFSLERFNWLSLHRRDYLEPNEGDLRTAVRNRVSQATGWEPDGPIELITHPRYLGYVFNPVSFYFCYRKGDSPQAGAVPRVILAQITNTPWQERHTYCLECREMPEGAHGNAWLTCRFRFQKRFHVSPFNPMNQEYRWLFAFRGEAIRIHMSVHGPQRKVFDATLVVRRDPLDRKKLNRNLRTFPLEAFKVVAGIYWQALKLRLKGATFHAHPDKLPAS